MCDQPWFTYICKECVNLLTSLTFFWYLKVLKNRAYSITIIWPNSGELSICNGRYCIISAFHCRTANNSLGKSLYLIPINNRKWCDDKKNSHQCCTKALFYLSKESRVFFVWNPCVAVISIIFVMMHSRCTRILQEKLWNPSKLWYMGKNHLFHDFIIWGNI